ncbi:unnamed protein product [Clonostachys rosea f. rosea IK726]|uniref:Uncharacterized protein n=1 Tax=Clonostachys rosea f. rosea IK726 TaxID=1349383 RepID=A0ACA9UA61_BIOOC|nr:unnamed protein product [Clonostachys rosea f. rosea IK726]
MDSQQQCHQIIMTVRRNHGYQHALKTTFDVGRVLRPIFTGGSVSIDNDARILATTISEDVILTEPGSGKHLGSIEGTSNPKWISSHRLLSLAIHEDLFA